MARIGSVGSSRDHRAAAHFAFGSALLFVFAALIYMDAFAIEQQTLMNAPGGFEAYMSLNVTTLQARWAGRRAAQGPHLFAELSCALAWFCLMPPVTAMTAQLGGTTRSANSIVALAFQAVALITIVDVTFQAGTISLVDWVSSWPLMAEATDGDGGFGALQALELAWLVGQSRTTWLFALDELLLSVGWFTSAWLIYTTRGHVNGPPLTPALRTSPSSALSSTSSASASTSRASLHGWS